MIRSQIAKMTIDHLINDNGGGESTLNEDFDT
jgi:hypothetical protein